MHQLNLTLLIFTILIAGQTWCQSEPQESSEDDATQLQLLSEGRGLLDAGRPTEAISECLDKVIMHFKVKYEDRKEQIYCARTSSEELMYLSMAAQEERNAIVISSVWADAYFMKGFALLELSRVSEAKQAIQQALLLSPNNSQYLSELGYIYQVEKDWARSLEYFKAAEEAAFSFSPKESKKLELGRARRGLGYVFVEMEQLDKAKEKYQQCLEEDPNDDKAKAELEYIQELQTKKE